MVRLFLLTPEERTSIENYINDRPSVMSDSLRQARMKLKRLGSPDFFDQLRNDVALMERFAKLKIRRGRNRMVRAGFTVKQEIPEEKK